LELIFRFIVICLKLTVGLEKKDYNEEDMPPSYTLPTRFTYSSGLGYVILLRIERLLFETAAFANGEH